jgi:meso-butanediol dehydrogenase / (S,S)-butanediol dehydrogenase / diacetyl reductase
MLQKRLSGKIALITGTAGGQGRAAAKLFAAEGAKVVGCDKKVEENRATVAMVKAAGGEMVAMAPLDLADETQVKSLIDFAVQTYGDFDILYNNGSATRAAPIGELSLENWQFALNNEMTNIFLAVKHALPVFQRRGQGVILNTASVAGMVGAAAPGNFGMQFVHNATKAAVIRMSQHLAVELSPWNIRVNAISPGIILTPATDFWLKDLGDESFTDMLLIKRVGQPEEVARAALFLVSDESSYVTGTNFVIDGGWTACGGLGRPNPEWGPKFVAIKERYKHRVQPARPAKPQNT